MDIAFVTDMTEKQWPLQSSEESWSCSARSNNLIEECMAKKLAPELALISASVSERLALIWLKVLTG